jgi:hypothetical protein
MLHRDLRAREKQLSKSRTFLLLLPPLFDFFDFGGGEASRFLFFSSSLCRLSSSSAHFSASSESMPAARRAQI